MPQTDILDDLYELDSERELERLTAFDDDGAIKLTRWLSDPRYDVPLSGFYW